MIVKLHFASLNDYTLASQWNPIGIVHTSNGVQIDTSNVDTNNPNTHIVNFKGIPDSKDGLNTWVSKPTQSPLSILLTHYNPLKKIMDSNGYSLKDMYEILDKHNGLPAQYQNQVISFHDFLANLGEQIGIDTLKMVTNSDVIICCWEEFVESPHNIKLAFQSKCKGAVYVHGINPTPPYGSIQLQSFYSYNTFI